MLPIHTILHPTDFSPLSEHALQVACTLAQGHAGRVVLLHVAPPPPPTIVGYHATGVSPRQRDEQYLEALRDRLRWLGCPIATVAVEHRLEVGDAATEVLRVARELKCDLIVMGTHGRTGLGRLLMGSVAEQVVRRAPCPVLTVKVPPSDRPSPAPPAEGPEAALDESIRGAFKTPHT